MALAGSVLLPLYVYPSAGAWQPLFTMAANFPNVHFTAIVNPHSGPGGASPAPEYAQALQILHTLTNVRTVGYVATTWCTKNVSSVLDEIALYAAWGSQDPTLSMSGIFFDEVAANYTPATIDYMKTISRAVHSASGLAESYVVHNPGVLPDAQYFRDPDIAETADLTVVYEDGYANWIAKADNLTKGSTDYDRERLACLMHSVPSSMGTDATQSLLRNMLQVGQTVYLTATTNYTQFDSYFPVFVDSLDTLVNEERQKSI